MSLSHNFNSGLELASPAYLREQAVRCTSLARDCPHAPTSHELEVLGLELMQKAEELDRALAELWDRS